MPRLIQPYNPNEQHQHPLLFDNAVPIRNVPEYNVGMGTYTRASQMRDAVLRFSSSPQLQTNEAEATRYIAMILASTQMPVYKVTVNNQTRRIVLNQDFNNLFNQLLEDPAVQVIAHDFATNR